MTKRKKSSGGLGLAALFIVVFILSYFGYTVLFKYFHENIILKKMVERLTADSRIAEVLVADVKYEPGLRKSLTTIKFLEYDAKGQPLAPRYFTFLGNVIQFQSLVIRFNDDLVKKGEPLRGKSAYLFWKVFILDGKNTQEYTITDTYAVPEGYRVSKPGDRFENELWEKFWEYGLDPEKAGKRGIKNAQIEAPGTKFVPGMLYTIKIEHDGGMRIDAKKIPEILKGEKALK